MRILDTFDTRDFLLQLKNAFAKAHKYFDFRGGAGGFLSGSCQEKIR